MINKYVHGRELFKSMVKEEVSKVQASSLVGSGLTPKMAIQGQVEFKDNLFSDVSLLSQIVEKEIANKNVKNVSKLIVKSSKKLDEKEKTADVGLVS